MSRLTRDGTPEPVSRDQILRRERGQGNVHFPCSADHEQDWQPRTVCEGGCRFMAAWAREEEKASGNRQTKREAEEADKVHLEPRVTVASFIHLKTALIGPTQELPKRRRLCR